MLSGEADGGSRDRRCAVARSSAEAAALGGPGRYRGAAAAAGGRGGGEIPRVGGSGEIEGRCAGSKIRRGIEEGERRAHRKTTARFRPRLNAQCDRGGLPASCVHMGRRPVLGYPPFYGRSRWRVCFSRGRSFRCKPSKKQNCRDRGAWTRTSPGSAIRQPEN